MSLFCPPVIGGALMSSLSICFVYPFCNRHLFSFLIFLHYVAGCHAKFSVYLESELKTRIKPSEVLLKFDGDVKAITVRKE